MNNGGLHGKWTVSDHQLPGRFLGSLIRALYRWYAPEILYLPSEF